MRKKLTLTAVAVISGLVITSEALGWGGYHQFSDYYNPLSSPDYFNPSSSRSPDYFNPNIAGANNPFSDYFNPGASPQNGRSGAYGYSSAYSDPMFRGYVRRW